MSLKLRKEAFILLMKPQRTETTKHVTAHALSDLERSSQSHVRGSGVILVLVRFKVKEEKRAQI